MAPPRRPETEPVESRRAQRHQRKIAAKRRRTIIAIGAVVLLALVATTVFLAVRDDEETEDDPPALLVLNEYSITGSLIVQAGDVTFAVANLGKLVHNVGVRGGPITADLFPDQGAPLTLRGLQPGTYELFCDITGHVERGMVAELQVMAPVVPTTT